jgi:hypothetical protein
MKELLITMCFLLAGTCSPGPKHPGFKEKVIIAIERQLKIYPESRIQDIYKNFFQDKFGPGHIITDTAAAGAYLRNELESYNLNDLSFRGPLLDTLGWEHRFVRVDLRAIKEGKLTYECFFNAFLRSMENLPLPSVEEWQEEWTAIVTVLEQMDTPVTRYPDYEEEKKKIAARLATGDYTGHHSNFFSESYAPHYRIISAREIGSVGF